MLSRSLGNRGWEQKCSVKYSCNESRVDKAQAAVKAITYVLLPNLSPSANLVTISLHFQLNTHTHELKDHY